MKNTRLFVIPIYKLYSKQSWHFYSERLQTRLTSGVRNLQKIVEIFPLRALPFLRLTVPRGKCHLINADRNHSVNTRYVNRKGTNCPRKLTIARVVKSSHRELIPSGDQFHVLKKETFEDGRGWTFKTLRRISWRSSKFSDRGQEPHHWFSRSSRTPEIGEYFRKFLSAPESNEVSMNARRRWLRVGICRGHFWGRTEDARTRAGRE